MYMNCHRTNQYNQQLLVNANRKKYYLSVIKKTNYYSSPLPKRYSPEYYMTSYSRIFYPNQSIIPN